MVDLDVPFVGGVALGWLERDARAKLIVDTDLRIIWGNQRASETASLIDAINLDQNLFVIKDPEQYINFKDMLANLKNDVCTCWPLKQSSPYLDVVNVIRIQHAENVYFAIELFTDNPAVRREYLTVWRRLKLTLSEQEVLLGLLDGKTPQEVAEARNVGLDTIRAHIRAIYGKLDVCNREQLFNRLSAFCR